jgi:CRISPR-associated protein Cmr5
VRTRDQERAEFAYKKIREVKNNNNYKSLVRGFPTMILQNGLGQALAFLKAKGEIHHLSLYNHINEWLGDHENNAFDILKEIISRDSFIYRLYTKETLLLLIWLKKFAEAEIEDNSKKE